MEIVGLLLSIVVTFSRELLQILVAAKFVIHIVEKVHFYNNEKGKMYW